MILTKDGKILTKDGQILTTDGSGGGGEEYPSESIAYYKNTRNKDYPYLPLPYEMEQTETEDTIYMLYDATGYMCRIAFELKYTNCVCTLQKYMNTNLINEEIVEGNNPKFYFDEKDKDYATYNYIVIKLQGNITGWNNHNPVKPATKNYESSDELIEVSGKCKNCSVRFSYFFNTSQYTIHRRLEYFSFISDNITDAQGLFYNCTSLKCIPELETKNIQDLTYAFTGCINLKCIPILNLSNCISLNYAFQDCTSLNSIPQLDTSNVKGFQSIFNSCTSLLSIPQLDTTNSTNNMSAFQGCKSLKTISYLDVSNSKYSTYMFENCYSLEKIGYLNLGSSSAHTLFKNCYKLTSISQLNTDLTTDASNMFNGCYWLKYIPKLNTDNVTSAYSMFNNCESLPIIDISHFNLSSSKSNNMFYNCKELKTLIIRSFGENYVLSNNCFDGCTHLKVNKDGYIYVPRDMVDTLKSATNWSTYADQFRALEDYTVDGTTTGDLDESKVNA